MKKRKKIENNNQNTSKKPRKMRVLLVIDNFNPSLNYREVHYAKEISKKEEVFVLTSTNVPYQKNKKFQEGIKKKGFINIIRKKPFLKIKDFMFSLRGYKKTIKKINPDVIHVFEGVKISTAIIGLWAKRRGYPIIYEHENRIKGGRQPLTNMKYWLGGRFFEKKIAKKSDKIRVVTPSAKDYLIKNYDLKRDKIILSNLGCSREDFYPSSKLRKKFRERESLEKQDYVVGFTGKISYWKRVDTIINAFKKIKNKNFKFLVFGRFYGSEYERLKKICGEDSRIVLKKKFMGKEELNEFYNGVDSMCWTHVTISIFESLATKTPTILPFFGGTKHISKISSGVFYYGKGKKLFDSRERIIKEPKRIKKIKSIIVKKPSFQGGVSKDIFWENICEKLHKQYKEIVIEKNEFKKIQKNINNFNKLFNFKNENKKLINICKKLEDEI